MTGTSKGLNCDPPLGSISVDSDIVGPGALAAFFITAVITITAVIFGYLSGSLGDQFKSDLDRNVINWAETKTRSFRCPTPPRTASGKEKFREARKQAVTQFILALSDQQLVTGLAILISGVANQKQLSGYEFSVVLCLAWFSSTTHLATLDALQTYLRSHSVIRDIRVCAMVLVLALLLYAFCVTIISLQLDSTIPVQCVFSNRPDSSNPLSLVGNASSVIALLILVYGYCVRIWSLYFDDGTLCRTVARVSSWLPSGGRKSPMLTELGLSHEQHIQVWHAVSRAASLRFLLSLPTWMRQVVKGSYLVQESFLSSFTGIAYSFAYGVSQVIFYRWLGAPSLNADTDYMGFGQIMAIFLLVLPFLAATECYHDYIEKVSQSARIETISQINIPSQQRVVDHSAIDQRPVLDISDDSDIQTIRTAYTRLCDDIINYLAPDVFLIRHFEAQQCTVNNTELTLLDGAKASVLIEYLRFKECEKAVTITSAIGFFTFTLLIWIIVGVSLNISTSSSNTGFAQGLITALVFSILLVGKVTDLVTRVFGLRRRLFVNSIALQEQQEQIDRGRGTAVQLTQIRRGATGLVEEGQR